MNPFDWHKADDRQEMIAEGLRLEAAYDSARTAYAEEAAKHADTRAERNALRSLLKAASERVCSLECPSTWRTADGQPPHADICKDITAALGK